MTDSVTLLLGGDLRYLHPQARRGAVAIDLPRPEAVRDFLARLGIPAQRAHVVLINHKKAFLDTLIQPGDRIGVWPPELAYNSYVAIEMAHRGQTPDGER